ncbi:MAG: enoyl-CoA hydratase/isomerase family protein [Microthrixaceae bacterium]
MADQMILTETLDDGVHVITLTNPKVNALNTALLDELAATAESMSSNDARAVVVTGGEKVFAAGADITEFGDSTDSGFEISQSDVVARIGGAFLAALNAVAAIPCPTIAAVNGVALGGGCELALACDFRVAASGAAFGQPEILLGIIPGGGGTQRLARLVGPAVAKDLVFSGRTVKATDAKGIGLVDTIAEGDALDSALAMARRYAAGPRHATALAKRAIDGGLDGSLADGLALEQELFVASFTTPDAEVGVASFLEFGPGKAEFG